MWAFIGLAADCWSVLGLVRHLLPLHYNLAPPTCSSMYLKFTTFALLAAFQALLVQAENQEVGGLAMLTSPMLGS